ncbi:MAG: serine hydrolase [Acidobacteria bacterium]|nr:serine hydrolase [Acidobacteriota bacterium]
MNRRQFVALPGVLPAAAVEPGSLKNLDLAVKREIEGFGGEVCLYAKNLGTGAAYGVREDERVRTASTIKLPVMAAVFAQVRAGQAKWDEQLTLREEDKIPGSGVLSEFSGGVKLPLRDVVHLMIVVSDNTATNLVLDRFTANAVNDYLDGLGLKETRSLRKVRGDGNQLKAPSGWSKAGQVEANKKYGLGVSTSREMVELLAMLDRGAVGTAEDSKEMLAILERQQYKDGIGRMLAEFKVQSKSGALDALRSDVGVVTTPKGRVAMALTVDGMRGVDYTADNAGLVLIGRLAPILCRGLGILG